MTKTRKKAATPIAGAVVENGDRARDKISGFSGIVTCMSTWINGCVRAYVQPEEVKKDGGLPEGVSFDVEQLDVLEKQAVRMNGRPTGGPFPNPGRRPDPK